GPRPTYAAALLDRLAAGGAADSHRRRRGGRGGCPRRRTSAHAKGLGAWQAGSAWATGNGLTWGQVAVGADSDEITAIPQGPELLARQAGVVTRDAAGCQKERAAPIVAPEADYVMAVKGHPPARPAHVGNHFLPQLEADAAQTPGAKEGRLLLIPVPFRLL